MNNQQNKQSNKIKLKKLGIRGDEVAILFFGLVFLIFVAMSSFRFTAIGKLFDDFIFLFLFGWSKYLVYLFLFMIVLPIFFNFYVKIRFSFLLAIFFTFFIISWTVQNITLLNTIFNEGLNTGSWWKESFYDYNHLDNFYQEWWKSVIINNYYGIFGQPLSFHDWTDVSSFFPLFAKGGIVASGLSFLSNYGGLITSWILNLLFLLIGIFWMLFSNKKFFVHKEKKNIDKSVINNEPIVVVKEKVINLDKKNQQKKKKSLEPKHFSSEINLEEKKKNDNLQKSILESGTLTPFEQIKKSDER